MAKNVFDNTLDVNNQVAQNSFDWTHTVDLTTDFGRLTPFFCQYVPPKTTFRVNRMTTGLQTFPTLYPVQTQMHARLNFFKFELRAANEDYTDEVSGTRNDIESPYVALAEPSQFSQMFGTSKLGDYLGLPTKVTQAKSTSTPAVGTGYTDMSLFTAGGTLIYDSSTSRYSDPIFVVPVSEGATVLRIKPAILFNSDFVVAFCKKIRGNSAASTVQVLSTSLYQFGSEGSQLEISLGTDTFDYILISDVNKLLNPERFGTFTFVLGFQEIEVNSDNTTYGLTSSPHKISVYPFRAYEAVYNCFYRDSRNNPFVLQGRPTYNKWLPTRASGPDSTVYTLHNVNWERDAFTTAVQNPQQGAKAPLAGITTYTTSRTLDTGEIENQVKTALITEDGKKYALDFKTDDEGTALTGVTYTELNSDAQVRPVTNLVELANSGLSIETLRYVNAYQKYLELNMRKGFSYRDIMQGRWDIDIRFDELLMPTFIGGMSRELNVNAVTQTVDQSSASDTNYESALGSQSGVAGLYGEINENIECFCDEASIIIGVLSVVPVPVYSQLTPKHFFYRDILDTPQPEFQNIGFQPILKKELNIFDKDGGEEVFGYQRPWYEFCQLYDTCHGAFRDSMGNFLMKRTFLGTPELSKSFLQVDPKQLSDVFAVNKVGSSPITDKIYGYVHIDATCKLPLNRVAIPRLE